MADTHPTRQTIERFLAGELSDEQRNTVLKHLLTDCPDCREITGDRWLQIIDGLHASRTEVAMGSAVAAPADSPYGAAFKRAIDFAVAEARYQERSWTVAYQLLDELLVHPPQRRLTLVRNSRRFRNPELCQILIDKGFDQRFAEVQRGVELTELAVAVGEQLDEEICTPAERNGLLGRAWAYHGNAQRVASELRLADKALKQARRCFEKGDTNDLDRALWCRFMALLQRARREFVAARRLQDQAIRLYLQHNESRIASHVMSDQGLALLYGGEPLAARARLEQALALVMTSGSAREIANMRHNLAYSLAEVGEPGRALEIIAEVRPVLQESGDTLSLMRLRWLEGKILFGMDRDHQAEEALVEARDAFIEETIGYDTALICLDLALLYARQGRSREMRQLAESMVPIFQSRDVHREALAALILFREAAVAETATLTLIERVGRYLRLARHDPKLRFELP